MNWPRRRSVAAIAAACVAWLAVPIAARADGGALSLVGHEALGARGLNAGLALAGRCAFVGSRGQGPVAIVDISDPAHPRAAGSIPGRANTTARELRAVPDLNLLVVMSYALGRGGANRFDVYRWESDCTQPQAAGSYVFATGLPHEFFLWRDGADRHRVLLFTTMFGSASPDLRVIDISDPTTPRSAGGWQPPAGPLHSISLDGAGRAYLALWTGGLAVADVSDFTAGRPDPQVRLLTPAPVPAPSGGNVHSAVLGPGGVLLTTDERYPPACPYGPARTFDISDPAHPRQLAVLAVPENDLAACRRAAYGTYTSHNPTLTRSLAFASWYSAGLQVFDISDPAAPARLAEYRPQLTQANALDQQLGATAPLTWSYPVLRDGLVWVVDINQGLLVLRYSGPHEAEVADAGFSEGNSNLRSVAPAVASPAPGPSTAPPAVASTPRPRTVVRTNALAGYGPLLVVALLVLAVGAMWWRRR